MKGEGERERKAQSLRDGNSRSELDGFMCSREKRVFMSRRLVRKENNARKRGEERERDQRENRQLRRRSLEKGPLVRVRLGGCIYGMQKSG